MLKIIIVVTFLITFLLCGSMGFLTVQNRINKDNEEIERLILERSYRINEVLSQQLYKTQALAALVITGDGEVKDFHRVAAVLAADVPALAAFLLAPDGIVIDAYPIEENPTVIGLNFLDENDHAGNREAIAARDTGELVMGGPFILRQGILGLTGRYPVYLYPEAEEKTFWGLVTVSLKFPEALDDAALSSLDNRGVSYEIWRINPDTSEKQIIVSNSDLHTTSTAYFERPVTILNAEWHFRIYNTGSWIEYPETWISFLGTLSISLFITIVIQARYVAIQRASKFSEATQAKSKFLALISHEIRMPMNVILGISEIELANTANQPEVLDAFDKINNSSRMLLGIINDLLDKSKIETGKLELMPVDYSVPRLIYDTARLDITLIGDKLVEFSVEAAETLPSMLHGDEQRIRQILNNLISNAIKYTRKGNVTFAIDSEVRGDNITIIFTVKDTGSGLTKEQLLTLFDEYSMFNQQDNRKTEGTGLGMSITKKFVELMGGRIETESEPGVGSVFTVYIPQKPVDITPIGKETAEELSCFRYSGGISKLKEAQALMMSGKVLIVDDIVENLFVAQGLIESRGLTTATAISGYEALEEIRSGNVYDIIFLDYMMPGMDGMETVKKLREEGYKKPVVALTANVIAGMKKECLEGGFDEFMPKPINIIELDRILRKYAGNKQTESSYILSRLRDVPGLTVDSVLSNYGGKDEIYIDTVKITAGMLPERIDKTDRFIRSDIDAFKVEVHGIKSIMSNIGASTLSACAAQLERAALKADESFINENYPAFRTQLSELSDALNIALQSNDSGLKEKSDKSLLIEIIPQVKTAVENYDSILATELLSPYIGYEYEPEIDELLKKIASSLEALDYEDILVSIQIMEDLLIG